MKFDEFITNGKPNEADRLIGLLMASAAYFHSAHFETDSHARHVTYNKFFDAIPGLTDSFGEQWLGFSGKKYTPMIPTQSELPKDTIKMLELIIKSVDNVYSKMPNAIQNTLDEIHSLCYKTKYLLSLK